MNSNQIGWNRTHTEEEQASYTPFSTLRLETSFEELTVHQTEEVSLDPLSWPWPRLTPTHHPQCDQHYKFHKENLYFTGNWTPPRFTFCLYACSSLLPFHPPISPCHPPTWSQNTHEKWALAEEIQQTNLASRASWSIIKSSMKARLSESSIF